jgi:hypothetical protein
MGWTDSPAFFCAASQTARDVAEMLINQPRGLLPEHALEPFMLPSEGPSEYAGKPQDGMDEDTSHVNNFCRLLETFVDDFINVAQTTNEKQLRHLSRGLLHAIQEIFPPPSITGHAGEDPISVKKLIADSWRWSMGSTKGDTGVVGRWSTKMHPTAGIQSNSIAAGATPSGTIHRHSLKEI